MICRLEKLALLPANHRGSYYISRLALLSVVGGLGAGVDSPPAFAQTAVQIQQLQDQIRQLQERNERVYAELEREEAKLTRLEGRKPLRRLVRRRLHKR